MSLSKLSAKCMACPYVENCGRKKMEIVGFLPGPQMLAVSSQPVEEPVAQSPLRETMKIRIAGKPMVVYKDEIEKQIYGHLYNGLTLRSPAT